MVAAISPVPIAPLVMLAFMLLVNLLMHKDYINYGGVSILSCQRFTDITNYRTVSRETFEFRGQLGGQTAKGVVLGYCLIIPLDKKILGY
jgi:hypothetical protein